jgi:hypothetical protein
MPVSISGTNGVTFPDSSLQAAAASPYVLKNRIINGDMRIDQRNAGASITATTSSFAVDRFVSYNGSSSSVTTQQSSIVPTGFSKSLSLTCVTGSSPTASQQAAVWQRIEGFNVADLNFGTANAQTITLSFWVRSSVTGTYCVYFVNGAYNRSYVATYTISAANIWEQKSITIVGDTSGTWPTDNSRAMAVGWSLGSGSSFTTTAGSWQAGEYQQTSSQAAWSSTTGATFYITGVQLEQNTSATPFERRLYNQELANCQRYYAKTYNQGTVPGTASSQQGALFTIYSSGVAAFNFQLPVPMRTQVTTTFYSPNSGTASKIQVGSTDFDGAINSIYPGDKNTMVYGISLTGGPDTYVHIVASAEL